MKSKTKSKITILVTLGIFFILSPIISINFIHTASNSNKSSEYSDEVAFDNEILKIAAPSEKIYIANNSEWLDFRDNGNCTGNGTYSEPYVIEDLVINAGWSGSCILIENSDVFFRIENCTLSISGGSSGNAGIRLFNVTNAKLQDNDCSSNAEGIYLSDCNNNTISGNHVSNNYNGIYLHNSYNNSVVGNTANNNDYYGITLTLSNDNIISGNTLNRDGIRLFLSNSTVSGNIMNECGLNLFGWNIEEFDSFKIDATNLVNGKPLYYYTNEVNLGPSDFTNAGQVILVNCNDSLISNLNVSYTSKGISLHFCQNNEVSDNIANNNIMNGIYLHSSNNNIILRNTASSGIGEQYYGIELSSSNNNTISDNIVTNNNNAFGYGIILRYSHSNLVSGNNASKNYASGIFLTDSNSNTITRNDANYNWNGIRLREGSFNIVSENNANDNANGIVIQESTNNEISNNMANNNVHGFFVVIYSDHNKILENKAENNEKGIYLGLSSENIISRNTVNTNDYGIEFEMFCNNNNITENIINYNSFTGIVIDTYSTGNYIFLNCFNNSNNAVDDGSDNHWDNGIKGNYWADYTGSDANATGIGDVPYNITGSAGSKDNFPLMNCPSPRIGTGGIPFELTILISIISGGAVIGVATTLLIRRKRKRIQ